MIEYFLGCFLVHQRKDVKVHLVSLVILFISSKMQFLDGKMLNFYDAGENFPWVT